MGYPGRAYKEGDVRHVQFQKWKGMFDLSTLGEIELWSNLQILECLFVENVFIDCKGLCVAGPQLVEVMEEHDVLVSSHQPTLIQRDALTTILRRGEIQAYLRNQFDILRKNSVLDLFSFFSSTWLFSYLSVEQSVILINSLFTKYLTSDGRVVFTVKLLDEFDLDEFVDEDYMSVGQLKELLYSLEEEGIAGETLEQDILEEDGVIHEVLLINLRRQ